jgi:pimeloyl-ACP methyl ester carboxylesterase
MTPSFLSLDGADDVFTVACPDGAVLPVYALDGRASGPALLFGHANGLSSGSYAPWLKELAKSARVFAYDARGNGGSAWPRGPLDQVFHVDRLSQDLRLVTEAVASRLGGTVPAYLGHSLGGASALDLAVSGNLPAFPALMLIEPPIFPGPQAKSHDEAVRLQDRLIAGTSKRRADWRSIEAFYERLKTGKGVFAKFDDAMLRAHCRATLKPKPEGGFTLCCPPDVECAIYSARRFAASWDRLAQVTVPLDLVGGDPNRPDRDWISTSIAEMAKFMPRARLTVLAGAGHMMIGEEPARILALVRRWLAIA